MGVEDSNAPSAPVITEYVGGALVTPNAAAAEVPVPLSSEPVVVDPAKPVESSEDRMFGKKFAALSRKEKEQRAAVKAFEAEKAAFEKHKADLEAQYGTKEKELSTKYISPEEFKKNPLELMKKFGMSFEQLAERVLNDGKPGTNEVISDTERRIQEKLEALEKKLADKEESEKARLEEERQQQFERQLTAFKGELTDFCNKAPDYEMIRANDAVGLVFEVIEEHYAKTLDPETNQGLILSNKEAADAVENYLLEEAKKQMNVNKVKQLAAQVVGAKPPEVKNVASPTLSNAHSAQPAPSKGQKLTSDEQSLREAAKLIKWQD